MQIQPAEAVLRDDVFDEKKVCCTRCSTDSFESETGVAVLSVDIY
jgi:hypothetical protein